MIQFTLDQINELLTELGKLPYIHSAHLIAGIKQIADAQLVAKKQQSDEIKEPDISLS